MKTLKLFAAMTVMCTGLQAQFTGITTYQYTQQLELTDGTNTSLCQGFLMAGVLPSGAGSSIYIEKTDVDGLFNGNPCEFANEYRFGADMVKPCGSTIVGATQCYGVSITELTYNAGAPEWYAITAAFDRGCLFAVLDMNGNIIPTTPNAYYTFPLGAIKVTKPLMTQSVFTPGWFYITGSYELNSIPHMYIMKVDINGNFIGGWTRDYVVSIGAKELVPSDIIESPYPSASGTKEVIVVGTVYDITGLNHEGFFFPIDIGTGLGNPILIYGSGGGSEEHFNGINIANSGAAGPPGYIIGGYSDFNPGAGTSWMLKIDPFGNIEWTSVIPSSTGTQGEVVAVTERLNTSGKYEYYGAATENKAMTVFKLDEFGNMFTASPNNEFIYNDFTGPQGTPVAITYNNIAGDVNEGIHVYGTNNNTPGDYLLTQAYFNGASGFNCNVKLNTITNNPGPPKVSALKVKVAKGPAQCPKYFFGNAPTPVNVIAPCTVFGFSGPYPPDNSKSAGVTGIKANAASDKFSVSPNPVTDKLSISYSSNAGANVSIGLYNNLGQLVTPMVTPKALQGTNTFELDLNTLNINSGVYFVTVTTDGASTTKKIIYTK